MFRYFGLLFRRPLFLTVLWLEGVAVVFITLVFVRTKNLSVLSAVEFVRENPVEFFVFLAFSVTVVPVFMTVMRRLIGQESGFDKIAADVPEVSSWKISGGISASLNELNRKISQISDKAGPSNLLDVAHQDNLTNELKEIFGQFLKERISELVGKDTIGGILQDDEKERSRSHFKEMRDRLLAERRTQATRAIFNLFIGVLLTIISLIILWSFIGIADFDLANLTKTMGQFSVRISVVIILQIFASFFLRLYKTGLDELKYFQNELTNIQSRMLGPVDKVDSHQARTVIQDCFLGGGLGSRLDDG